MLLPIIIVFAVGLWLLLALAEGRDLYRADEAWGDVIDLPKEARTATRKDTGGRGAASGSGPALTGEDIARHHGGRL